MAFHRWMQASFNPSTDLFGGDIKQFLQTVQFDEDNLPVGDEFAQTMLFSYPRSDFQNHCWWFDNTAMRCLSVDGIRRRPQVGHATGEIQRADAMNAMMDLMPEGTIMASTIVVVPQDTVEGISRRSARRPSAIIPVQRVPRTIARKPKSCWGSATSSIAPSTPFMSRPAVSANSIR